MKVSINAPAVPDYVFVDVPGAARRSKVALTELSHEDVLDLGRVWTLSALKKAGHGTDAEHETAEALG